jgi:hypothetical protein
MTTKHFVPAVEWVSCGVDLPEPGRFVWVVVGRTLEAGEARRYLREVHMGVYNGMGFQIFPYSIPPISSEVWAWASMTPPNPPFVRQRAEDDEGNDEEPFLE